MERLDALIVGLGLVPSRSKAQRLIRDGHVLVDGVAVTKPAANVATASSITVDKGDDYVSRGAYKLIGAFDEFSGRGLPSPRGLRCLDIGASTGGFCDVLLRRGAAQVIALDVGHGQLDSRIARDPRVIEMSGVNIRDVTAANLPYRPDMIGIQRQRPMRRGRLDGHRGRQRRGFSHGGPESGRDRRGCGIQRQRPMRRGRLDGHSRPPLNRSPPYICKHKG